MSRISQADWELFRNLARREIRGRYKGSFLGLLWTLIIPLVLMATYTVVFSVLWQVADLPNYWLYLLVGIGFWAFFGGGFIVGSTSLVSNQNLITKVNFPRVMLPIAALSSQAITMVVMISIIVPASILVGSGSVAALLLLPVVFVPTAMLVVGLALAMSVLNVYFRDVEHIVGALLIPWFFITPIIYSLDALPQLKEHEWARTLLQYGNIATPFVMSLQDILYYGRAPGLGQWAYMIGVGSAVLVGGYLLFDRLQRDLAVEL